MHEENRRNPWYALTVKPRHEKSAGTLLRTKGFEEFVPCYRARHKWSDRVKELDLPLFPGYVFCRFQLESRVAVLSTPGVRQIVGMGRIPARVPEPEIDALRTALAAKARVEPWPYLEIGARVVIEQGPLQGLEGILLTVKGDCRLVLSVTLLQRSVAVEIDRARVRGLPPARYASAGAAAWGLSL